MIPENELITKVRVRNIKTILSNVFVTQGGGGGGSGDVVGPSVASNGDLALFDGTTGKLIKVLSGSNDDFTQKKSGVWTNRSISQVRSDLKTPSFYSNNTPFSTTSTSEVVADAACLIPGGTLQANDHLLIWAVFTKSGTNNAPIRRFRVNTVNNLIGSPVLIAVSTPATITLYSGVKRHMGIIDLTNQFIYNTVGSTPASDELNDTNAYSALTINFAVDQYIMPTIQGGGAGTDTNTLRGWYVQIIRS